MEIMALMTDSSYMDDQEQQETYILSEECGDVLNSIDQCLKDTLCMFTLMVIK